MEGQCGNGHDAGSGMSPETLALFADLLDRVQVSAAQPDFDEVCAQVSRARRELAAARAEAAAVSEP